MTIAAYHFEVSQRMPGTGGNGQRISLLVQLVDFAILRAEKRNTKSRSVLRVASFVVLTFRVVAA